ncbi:unnamed protein product [Rotaria magnacalcarata]|uniref:Potassium channel domain-containing protein n=1 Tax=Rotaria magnacalcarata TaxID=392030 RepID=A0A816PXA0_9BILA|nr:unnamed protein product [Rotaria magnacalcarata]CAF1486665.1 unnamed protein product [Rotaria magnacalcarata]CAF2053995.1 unnamed protein product [Rotaria magnacalcarata]CAF3777738.1 unnamed protein product [Rotaria magnacalcarata]CAF3799259.1 unnamed protein product [Rotaria magnacalcarata]
MPKKFNIREWVLSVKYWSLLFIPHVSICLMFLIYILIGASIIQEIETYHKDASSSSSSTKNFPRERLISNIIEKRQIFDIEQFTKYVYKHICQYEQEIIKRKQQDFKGNLSWNFSRSLFFIITSLTTISSSDFIPKTNIGKIFLMIYTGFGVPLTLVLLIDLSYLIKRFIKNISLIILYFYSSKNFYYIRRLMLFRFIDKQLNISIEDEDQYEDLHVTTNSSSAQQYCCNFLNIFKKSKHNKDLTLVQLMITLFIYIVIGTYFIPSKSFLDSFYLCFTTIFTISLNKLAYQDDNLFFITIYLIFGLAVMVIFIETIKIRLEMLLVNIARLLVRNLLDFSRQIGAHDLRTDDSLVDNDINYYPSSESMFSRHPYIPNSTLSEQQSSVRPIGVAEPLRRLSTDLIRVLKNSESNDDTKLHKGTQVTTIIRRCNRCAESPLPVLPIRKHSLVSNSSSSVTDNSSSCEEDDDAMELPLPNLDRIRKRRATLVAKTIINQMATQSRSSSIDEFISPFTLLSKQRHRSAGTPSTPVRCSVKITLSPSLESSRKFDYNQSKFSEISQQISSLVASHEDLN